MAVYSSLWLAMAALVVTCVRAELSASSTVMPEEEASVLEVIIDAPKEDVFFIFDIKGSQLTSDDVNNAFAKRPVVHQFKVIGAQRFIVVLKSVPGDRASLRDLVIGQATDVQVYTAERFSEFMAYDDVPGLQDKEPLRLQDENLYMCKITIREEGMNLTTFKNDLKEFFESSLGVNFVDVRDFRLTAFFPFTLISFIRLSPYRIDRALLAMSDFVGGPYQLDTKIRPIVNI